MNTNKKNVSLTTLFFIISILLNIFPQFSFLNGEIHDLSLMKQSFVLNTKRIIIPGYPDAFNPSIVQWNDQLLMTFRFRDPITQSTDAIAFVTLDDNFNPISQPTILQRNLEITCSPSYAQDARLIVVNNKLYAVYSNNVPYLFNCVRRMIVAEVSQNGNSFEISAPTPYLFFDGEDINRKEKNWVPFAYENNLYLGYSINPHTIFGSSIIPETCTTIASTQANINWEWGQLRGGTPALLVDGQYIAFFHSVKAIQSVQSGGKLMTHYFMGAYTFNSSPPFQLTALSPHPIVANSFYQGLMYVTWEPLREIFPCGYIYDDNNFYVTYGRQDHECWVVTLDKVGLLNSLKSVVQRQSE